MSSSRCFATIISPNYLAYARVLRDSLAMHAPGAPLEVLIVGRDDDAARAAVAESGLDATFASALGLPDFEQLAYKFDIVELNTALKPTFLKALFARGHDEVVYLDPDIRLFAPLAPVDDALREAEIVLIPHSLAPVMDGLRPSDIDFLRGGTFNLGFIALRRGSQSAALLDWWERRCLAQGFNDPSFGTFVDQKWLDLAPSYFERVKILKHRGCNVAYWNLHEREVTQAGGQLRVDGEPLVFFHFSGVDVRAPDRLSRHQSRHVPEPGSLLAGLVRDYCDALLAAGHGKWSGLIYPFGRLDDGTPITSLMRRAAACLEMDAADPFKASSPFQRELRARGLVQPIPPAPEGNTLNFDAGDRRVRTLNALLRGLARVAGAERVRLLLRYATFLSWGSNLPAVLLRRPLDVEHRDRR
jgi:hypothetical protein